jgi:5-methylcytosine-specific restriction endonuclease McrA
MAELRYEPVVKTVQDIINLWEDGHLNLEPGFQRDSVWNERDRQKLIDSIVRGWPLPSIFVHRRAEDGEMIYDVIDGKQRLESILMFVGQMRGNRYWAKVQLPGEDERDWVDWNSLRRRNRQHLITGYKLHTIEVDGGPADVIDLFVRINSTGKALTSAERRHAQFYDSRFLKTAGKLAAKFEPTFRRHRIMSQGQIARMKHVELVCELMLSVHTNDVINKKAALDRIMKADGMTDLQIQRAKARTAMAIKRILKIIPHLKATRFRQLSDFYTLAFLIAQFETEGRILTDKRRNRLAGELLAAFSTGVDQVRERQKRAQGIRPGEELYRDYLVTVLEGTDEISQRKRRATILRSLLESLFARKDAERLFSSEQRRILWNTTAKRICRSCRRSLTWEDFSVDHIQPHSKGGRTKLENAAVMCRGCNAAKGNRRLRRAA